MSPIPSPPEVIPMASRASVATALAAVFMTISPAALVADNWPQWRGPNNDGISKETNLPTTWDAKTNIAWTLDLPGFGGSTPVVWGDRIFLTSEADKEVIGMCISTAGKELWRVSLG